ncbi:retropepsin-like aspartic protease [Fibrella arboris]|uniref:retropepsin-like aspartic protease n=1 Tax=Fibrella arboris TaxID=3242486 RepID=UPI003522FD70
MSIIKLPLLFEGSKSDKTLYALFDSGANLSCISDAYASELTTLIPFKKSRLVSTAAEGHYIEIKHKIAIDFYLNDVHLSDEFLVIPGLSEEAIIGAATMQKWRIKLDFEHDTVIVDPKVAKLQLI